jgi:hypothetical protein
MLAPMVLWALLTRPPLTVDSVRMQLSGSVKDTKPTFLLSTTTWKDSWVPICGGSTKHSRVSDRSLTANNVQAAQQSGYSEQQCVVLAAVQPDSTSAHVATNHLRLGAPSVEPRLSSYQHVY